jgi:hypothetical protein
LRKRRIYVASSWRNEHQQGVVGLLRAAGHEVYDFKNPAPGQHGFHWRDCGGAAAEDGPGNGAKTIPTYLAAIVSQRARDGFALDKQALDWCDTCVLVLPCGRSAHLEAGYTAGQGKDTYFLLHPDKFEPELMYLLGTGTTPDLEDIMNWMDAREPGAVYRWHLENGGTFKRPANHALRLLREVVELCIAAGATQAEVERDVMAEIVKADQKGEFGGSDDDVPQEWADCAMLLEVFRAHAGIDQHAEIRKKLDILWERPHWEPDEGGALYRPRRVAGYMGDVNGPGLDPDVR